MSTTRSLEFQLNMKTDEYYNFFRVVKPIRLDMFRKAIRDKKKEKRKEKYSSNGHLTEVQMMKLARPQKLQ